MVARDVVVYPSLVMWCDMQARFNLGSIPSPARRLKAEVV